MSAYTTSKNIPSKKPPDHIYLGDLLRLLLTTAVAITGCSQTLPSIVPLPPSESPTTSVPSQIATSTRLPTETTVTAAQLMPADFYTAFNDLESVDTEEEIFLESVDPVESFFKVKGGKLYINVRGMDVEVSPTGQFGAYVDSEGKLIDNPLASLSVVGADGNTYGFKPESQTWFNAAEFLGSADIFNPKLVSYRYVLDGTLTRAL
jgi:hypothetical protein